MHFGQGDATLEQFLSRFAPLGVRGLVAARALAAVPLAVGPTDEELVARARQKDSWALEALYRRHVHRVTGVVAKLLRHGADIEDVVQDTFVDAFEELAALRAPEHVGRWIVGIAVHKAHRRFRKRKLLRTLGLDRSIDDERLVNQLARDAGQDVRVEVAAIDAALDTMAADERLCFVLRHLEGYSLEEAATLAGVSLATVKRKLAKAESAVARVREEELR